jgi:hypothetical protein
MLKRIFGRKRGFTNLNSEETHNLRSSPNIITMTKSRRMKWTRHVACMGTNRNAYRVLAGKLEGKRPLGRLRRRGKKNITMDLTDMCGLD